MYIDYFIGTRLAEYEVFVQYYSKLIRSLLTESLLQSYPYRLYMYIRDYITTRIILHPHHFVGINPSGTKLLLAIIAMELHCGETSSFYTMLTFMENSEHHFGCLGAEIEQMVETFDPHNSYGTYVYKYVHTY